MGSGEVRYYADHCPNVANTLKFVAQHTLSQYSDRLEKNPTVNQVAEWNGLVKSSILQEFRISYAGDDYSARGISIAKNLEDNITPEMVINFRKRLLKLLSQHEEDCKTSNHNRQALLTQLLSKKMYEVFSPILLFDDKSISGSSLIELFQQKKSYMIVGTDKQCQWYETYLNSIFKSPTSDNNDDAAKVLKIYPRDFWMSMADTDSTNSSTNGHSFWLQMTAITPIVIFGSVIMLRIVKWNKTVSGIKNIFQLIREKVLNHWTDRM